MRQVQGSEQHARDGKHDCICTYARPGSMVMESGPPLRVQLPACGWHIGFRALLDGRTIIEVTDCHGRIIGQVTSTRQPIWSIDAGWIRYSRHPGNDQQWLALAIGRATTATGQPTVTFTSSHRARHGTISSPASADSLWVFHDGLWVAVAPGRYTHVRLSARPTDRVRRLQQVFASEGVAGELPG
jgi:hypothetical protein